MYVSCITFSFYPEADTGRMAVVWYVYRVDAMDVLLMFPKS
jgi:hypothetical protein